MAQTGTAQITQATTEYFNRRLLTKAVPYLPHAKWADIADLPRNNGTLIRRRRYTLLTVATTPIVEGVTPDLQQLAVTNVDTTVQEYGSGVLLTRKLLYTTLDPILREVNDLLAQNAGNTLDQLNREELATTTTKQYASTATSTATVSSVMKLTKQEIMEAVRTLKNNNAMKITEMVDSSDGFNSSPLDACFVGLVHPNATYDLKQIPGFIRVEEYGSQKAAMENEVGTLDEVRFIETTNAKVRTAGGAGSIDVYSTIILAKEAYMNSRIAGEALRNIIQGPGGNADPFEQRTTSVWFTTFATNVLNDAFVLDLQHAVSA
jgi:N4-gp56 family major capsid protein